MKILAVETATTWQSVAILEDDLVLAMHEQEAGGAQGSLLLPTIDRLLFQSGLQLSDLAGLACSIGPGSFTGIRVGLATCLGLRGAAGLPLTLVPTLEAMAGSLEAAPVPVCPMLVSRRGELYWAIFRWVGSQRLNRILSEQVGTPSALARSLTEHTMVFGSGWSSMGQDIQAVLPPSVTVAAGPDRAFRPSASQVARIGMEQLRRGEIAGEVIAPLYVQRAEAEIQYDRSGGVSPVARRQKRVETKIAERMGRARRR
ncbi:MAG: tRNA (adenosine(37)-N6)-threonylcarbamoyltransferase complex dimerization subunit type 1 TsaB [Nitrospira sp. LK70]|nr:tRNA (adenosine(37)-N6)-threonylcarbamoyltransferase complex dimerization subunit type 1 TsaB [Nitrospira sp. LK70]